MSATQGDKTFWILLGLVAVISLLVPIPGKMQVLVAMICVAAMVFHFAAKSCLFWITAILLVWFISAIYFLTTRGM